MDLSTRRRLASELDRWILSLADSAARRITRRTFLRRAGEIALVIGLATTHLLWGSPAQALDCNATDPNNELAGPCGPTELCPSNHCQNDNNLCKLSITNVRRRTYGTFTCGPDDVDNCWNENCCDQPANAMVRCCDCCTPSPNMSGQCNCTNPVRYPCICKKVTQVC